MYIFLYMLYIIDIISVDQIYIQYVGVYTVYVQYACQTTDTFCYRRLEKDFEITLIEKTDSSDPTKRKDFWIRALGTMAPKALNVALF